MLENIALSFRGIWNHKMRSVLTMLGIIIGIAAIITIVSTIKGTNDQIKENLIGAGSNVVNVNLQAVDGWIDLEYGDLPQGVLPIDEEVRASLEELDGVEEAALYRSRNWADSCYYKNTAFNGSIRGIDIHYLSVTDYKVNYGRGFVQDDYDAFRKVCLVDAKAMSSLFDGQNPLGMTIELKGEPFTVVGVIDKTRDNGPTINTPSDYLLYADQSSGTVFIPIETWSTVYRYDEPQTVAIKASSTDEMTKAGKNAADALNEAVITNDAYTYKAEDLLEQAGQLQSMATATNSQLIWIAGISLLVGGIGVMNIMLVSVTERTREIGLKKALGARRRRILWQFLTEAAVLTSLGGLLGVGTGIGLAKLLSSIIGTPASVSIPACLIAMIFSMAIGIIFGLIPAVKASKLNPIDALRRE